jgi:hypothetical protein
MTRARFRPRAVARVSRSSPPHIAPSRSPLWPRVALSLDARALTRRGGARTRPDGAQVTFEVNGDAPPMTAPGRRTVHQCLRGIPLGEGGAQ